MQWNYQGEVFSQSSSVVCKHAVVLAHQRASNWLPRGERLARSLEDAGFLGCLSRWASRTKDPARSTSTATTTPLPRPTPIYTLHARRSPTDTPLPEPLNLSESNEPFSRSRNVCFHRGECKPTRAITSERAIRARAQTQYRLLQGEWVSDSSRFRSSAGALSPSVSSTASHTRLLSPAGTRSPPQSTSTSARRNSSTRQRLPGHRRTRLRARAMDVSAAMI